MKIKSSLTLLMLLKGDAAIKINSSPTVLVLTAYIPMDLLVGISGKAGGSVTLKDFCDGYILLFARARAEAANDAVIHVTQRRVA